jgi:predicted O-methyltransferase YrrM
MQTTDFDEYLLSHTSETNSILNELFRETNLKILMPRMLAGPLQGKFLEMISCMIKPMSILEIGTYTGYSAICLSAGLTDGGMIHTIEKNPELKAIAEKYFEKAGLTKKVKYYLGNAINIIPDINEQFDLVFMDADKKNYLNYYKQIFDKVKTGGFIIADNALWDEKVLTKPDPRDKETLGIIEFNDFIQKDDRVENMLLPLRDGLMIVRKK